MGLFRCVVRYISRPDDDEPTAERKRLMGEFGPITSFVAFMSGVLQFFGTPNGAFLCFAFGATASVLVPCVYSIVTRRLPLRLFELGMIALTAATLIGDWANAASVGSARAWTIVVLVMDVLLTAGSSRWVQNVCIHSTAVWLVVTSVEDSFRLGLYDISGWSEMTDEVRESRTGCANPPCPTGVRNGLLKAAQYLLCLYVDFFATRGFAEGQRREQDRVLLMVRVAEQVAACLARFDLSAAAEALDDAGKDGLSPDLSSSYRRLLANLSCYRPYLPQSVFEDSQMDEAEAEEQSAGEGPHGRGNSPDGDDPENAVTQVQATWTSAGPPGMSFSDAGLQPMASDLSESMVPTAAGFHQPVSPSLPRDVLNDTSPRRRSFVPRARSQVSAISAASEGLGTGTRSRGCPTESLSESLNTDGSPDCMPTPLPSKRDQRERIQGRRDSVPNTPRLAHAAVLKRVSLVAINRTGLLSALDQGAQTGAAGLGVWLSNHIASFAAAVLAQKGLVDLISADHLYASFGSLKHQGQHRIAATRCATGLVPSRDDDPQPNFMVSQTSGVGFLDLGDLGFTSAVCTGHATCGDFGSTSVQRFMVVGAVAAFIQIAERIAAGWQVAVLVDSDVHSDGQIYWDCRLRRMVTFAKHSERQVGLWEVCAEKGTKRSSQGEWMYELHAAPPNPWAPYNQAVVQWCRGQHDTVLATIDNALTPISPPLSAAVGDSVASPTELQPQVADALRALRSAVHPPVGYLAIPPPCGRIPRAAGVGSPTPVRQDDVSFTAMSVNASMSVRSAAIPNTQTFSSENRSFLDSHSGSRSGQLERGETPRTEHGVAAS